jgi:2-methylcitrate dehydratase PrpD
MEIVSKGGETYRSQVDYPKGSLQNPMTLEDRRRKFRRLTIDMLSERMQEMVEEKVFKIEAIKDVTEILTIVAPGN